MFMESTIKKLMDQCKEFEMFTSKENCIYIQTTQAFVKKLVEQYLFFAIIIAFQPHLPLTYFHIVKCIIFWLQIGTL